MPGAQPEQEWLQHNHGLLLVLGLSDSLKQAGAPALAIALSDRKLHGISQKQECTGQVKLFYFQEKHGGIGGGGTD